MSARSAPVNVACGRGSVAGVDVGTIQYARSGEDNEPRSAEELAATVAGDSDDDEPEADDAEDSDEDEPQDEAEDEE